MMSQFSVSLISDVRRSRSLVYRDSYAHRYRVLLLFSRRVWVLDLPGAVIKETLKYVLGC